MFLYAALGAMCLILWNTWQKDYPPVELKTTVASSSESTNKDFAKASTILTSKKTAVTQTKLKQIVNVRTDVLDLDIDTTGGNIVNTRLLHYPVSLQERDVPIQLFSNNPDNFYVAGSGLTSDIGPDIDANHLAQYSTAMPSYELSPNEKELNVKLAWRGKDGLLEVDKIFTFTRGEYAVKVKYEINNHGNTPWQGNFFANLERKDLNENKGGMFSFKTFVGGAISSPEKPYEKLSYSSFTKENLARTIQGGWLSFQQQYFVSAWVPEQNKSHNYFSAADLENKIYTLGLTNSVKVLPHSKNDVNATLYVGPEVAGNLKAVAPNLDLSVDYGWLWPISVGLLWLMQQIFRIVGNWGWSIILLTVLIKLVFYKLSEKSYCSMAKMKDLAPKMQALKERFGDDKQKFSQASMELYKKEKVNPMGGCLPILIQIPVFIALYYVLIESVELRQAPFMFWIHDLAIRDPYYILPILMGVSMLIQQKLNPPPPDPMQAKMMMFLPVVFTVFFLSFPAGLVLYWLVNNCLSVLQQWYIMEKMKK